MKQFDNVVTSWEPDDNSIPVAPTVRTVDVQPPALEDAPALVVVLVASLLIALLAAAPLYIIGQMPMWISVIIGILVVGLLVFSYLGMRYQWFHMVSLQKTERLRIAAWKDVAIMALTVRQEWLLLQREQLAARQPQQVEQKQQPALAVQPMVKVYERGQEREIPKHGAVDMEVQEWVKSLYDGQHLSPRKVLGDHTQSPKQVQCKKPSPEAFAVLKRWGWVEDDGNVYRYYGPPTLAEVMTKFM